MADDIFLRSLGGRTEPDWLADAQYMAPGATLGSLGDTGGVPLSALGDPFEAAAARQRQAFRGRRQEGEATKLFEDLVIPKTPLDYASMFALGPGGRLGAKAATLGLSGLISTAGEAEAGPLDKAAKAAAAASRIPGQAKTGITAINLREMPLADALKIAKSEQHIIPKKEGGLVGAPSWVQNANDLQRMRDEFDAQVEAGMAGAPWYKHAQAGIKEIAGSDPAQQHLLAQEKALFSSQSTPDVNLGYTLSAHNAFEAGKPLPLVRTGAQARSYVQGRAEGEIPLGAKTGVYAKHLDPTLEDPITGTNDIWHARAFGYTNPKGEPWDAALTAQQHSFMDAETMLAVDRANARKLGGRSDWTAGEIQAAPWVARKTEGLMEQFGWPREKAAAEAIKTYNSFFDKYTAFGTHEATPGIGTRHLPDLPQAPYEVRAAYAADPRSTWAGPEGRDVMYNALGMYQRPIIPSTGVFQSAAGPLEINPAAVARPLVGMTGPAGERAIDPASRALLTAGEGARAYIDAQNMGAFSMPIRGQKAGQSLSAFLPTDKPLTLAEIGNLRTAGARAGVPDVIDYGRGSVLTSFGDQPTVRALGKNVQGMGVLGGMAERAKLDTGVVNFEQALARTEGSGAATRLLFKVLKSDDAPAVIGKLDADKALRAKVLDRYERDAEVAAKTGQPVREDIQRARQIIADSGFVGLLRALRAGVPLPATALVPVASALREQSQAE